MRGLGYPQSVSEFQELLDSDEFNPGVQDANFGQSDGSLILYNSNYNPIAYINFRGLFPVSLSTLDFNAKAQDINFLTASVTFKYTLYDIIVN